MLQQREGKHEGHSKATQGAVQGGHCPQPPSLSLKLGRGPGGQTQFQTIRFTNDMIQNAVVTVRKVEFCVW